MHVEIAECRDTARMHADYISQAPISKEGTKIDGTPDLVLWTDASANPQQQSGPSGTPLVFQTVDRNGHIVWQDVTFGVFGQRNIHDVELLAVLYSPWVALDMCLAKKQAKLKPAGPQDDMNATTTTDHTGSREGESSLSQDKFSYRRMNKVRIMSDSHKALHWIGTKKKPALTKLVHALVRKIEGSGFLVEFRWVPGHSVPGNKFVDKLAAEAAKSLILTARAGNGRKSQGGTYMIWPDRNRGKI